MRPGCSRPLLAPLHRHLVQRRRNVDKRSPDEKDIGIVCLSQRRRSQGRRLASAVSVLGPERRVPISATPSQGAGGTRKPTPKILRDRHSTGSLLPPPAQTEP